MKRGLEKGRMEGKSYSSEEGGQVELVVFQDYVFPYNK